MALTMKGTIKVTMPCRRKKTCGFAEYGSSVAAGFGRYVCGLGCFLRGYCHLDFAPGAACAVPGWGSTLSRVHSARMQNPSKPCAVPPPAAGWRSSAPLRRGR
jgi:hypothetical protein